MMKQQCSLLEVFSLYPNPQEVRYLECVLQQVNHNTILEDDRVDVKLLQLKGFYGLKYFMLMLRGTG